MTTHNGGSRLSNRLAAIALLFLLSAAGASAGQPRKEFIFENAPTAAVHASTIVELRNHGLLAAWFGGTAEGSPDVAIWGARKANGQWEPPRVMAREPNIACYNPVLFYSRTGRLWLYYKFGPHPTSWTAARRWSDDDGRSWSAIEHLPAGLYGPIRAKPLVLANGIIVSGTSVESYRSWASWIERSTDDGETWTRIGPIALSPRSPDRHPESSNAKGPFAWGDTYGLIQPSVVMLAPSRVRLYARSTAGRIFAADSADNGLHWTPAHALEVPNPNSGIDAVALRDGRVVLVFNNSDTMRTPLDLAVSTDGEHFRIVQPLESAPGEYSYPALIEAQGNLELTYTWKRQRICHWTIPLETLPSR